MPRLDYTITKFIRTPNNYFWKIENLHSSLPPHSQGEMAEWSTCGGLENPLI